MQKSQVYRALSEHGKLHATRAGSMANLASLWTKDNAILASPATSDLVAVADRQLVFLDITLWIGSLVKINSTHGEGYCPRRGCSNDRPD